MSLASAGCDRAPDDETFWSNIRAQYAVSKDFINLENGYFGVQAQPVFEAFLRHQALVNAENSYFMREKFASRYSEIIQALAVFCGVHADELVITRNLMEAMNILLQGYPFAAGDHVLCAAHDYDSVLEVLQAMQARRAIVVDSIMMPLDPESDAQIVEMYRQAITPKTRVLLLTHMVHRTGQIMPVANIAAMARSLGVDVMVDAAHSFAQIEYRIPDLGGDFVAVNLHKWLGAPLGVGLLYIRRPRIADIAPLYGDVSHAATDINKFSHFGTVPPAPILTIADALDFHLAIGSKNKEGRLRYLSQYWQSRVRDFPGVEMLTPRATERSCAIATFRILGVAAKQVVEHLMDKHRIFTITRDVNGLEGVRVTPHLYTRLEDLEALVTGIAEMCQR